MAEKLKTDSLDLDNDLDFSDFDMDGEFNPEATKKSRHPVISVSKGIAGGVVNKFKSPSFLAQVTKDAMPTEFGTILNSADSVLKSTTALYDDTVREVKPAIGRLAGKVNKLVPENLKTIKRITGKASDYFNGSSPALQQSLASQEDQNINTAISSIFGVQMEQQQKVEALKEAKQDVRDSIDSKRFKSTSVHMSSIDRNLSRLTQYNENINAAYQKKSLELQFRSYFAQAQILDTTKKYFETFRVQFESITKNTGLPEFVKIKESERFKETAKNKFYQSIQSGLFGNGDFLKAGMERIKKQVKSGVAGFKFGLEAGTDAVDSISSMSELADELQKDGLDIDKYEMASQGVGAAIGDKLGKMGADKLKPLLEKHPELRKFLYKGANVATDLPNALKGLSKSEFVQNNEYGSGPKSWLAKAVRWGADTFRRDAPDMSTDNRSEGYKDSLNPDIFNKRTNLSIIEIIPGYLSRIYREMLVMNGSSKFIGLTTYDPQAKDFKLEKDMASDIKSALKAKAKDYNYESKLSKTSEDYKGVLSDEDTPHIGRAFAKLANSDVGSDPDDIRKSLAYKSMSKEEQAAIDKVLDNIDISDEKDKGKFELGEHLRGIRSTTPDIRGLIQEYQDAGFEKLLIEEGVLKKDRNTGKTSINQEAMYKLLADENLPKLTTSDIHAKKGISKFTPKNILEGIKNSKVFNWQYKDGRGDGGAHVGPMAQDIQKNLGNDAAPGGKAIDMTTMNGLNMAAIQEVDKKVDQLAMSDSTKYLKDIRAYTGRLVGLSETALRSAGATIDKKSGKVSFKSTKATNRSVDLDGGYGDGFKAIFSGAGDILSNGVKDLVKGARTVGRFGKDKIYKPTKGAVKWGYSKAKDPIAEAMRTLATKGMNLVSSMIDISQDAIMNKLPNALRSVRDFGKSVTEKITNWINRAVDIYIPGIDVPVLRAQLLEAGMYLDATSKEVIKSLADIKGPVIDKAGNIILSAEDISKGLYDRYGKEIKLKFKSISGAVTDFVMDKAVKIKDKLTEGFKTLKTKVTEGYDKAKEKVNQGVDYVKEKDWRFSLPMVMSTKTHNVITQIRNILLRKLEHKKISIDKDMMDESAMLNVGKAMSSLGKVGDGLKTGLDKLKEEKLPGLKDKANSLKEQAKEKLAEYGDKAKEAMQKATDGAGTSLDGLKNVANKAKDYVQSGKAKDAINKVKEKFTSSDDFDGAARAQELRDKYFGKKASVDTEASTGKMGKLKAIGSKAFGKIGGIASMAGGLLDMASGSNDQKTTPTESQGEAPASNAPKKESLYHKVKRAVSGKLAFNDKNGDGERDGNATDRLQQLEERAAARKKDPLKADLRAKYTEGGAMKGIFDKLSGLLDFFKNGAGSIISTVADVFSGKGILGKLGGVFKLLGKGVMGAGGVVGKTAGLATKALGAVGSPIARGLSMLPGAARLAGIANTARTIGTIATLGTGGAFSAIAGIATTALSGVMTALASPVVLGAAAVAGLAYGGYRLYKYATRNNTTPLSKIRLFQYGFTDKEDYDRQYNSKIFTLENYLLDGRISYTASVPSINMKKVDTEELLSIFEIDKADSESVEKFTIWFSKCFKPFFLTHIAALFAINKKLSLEDVEKLKSDEKIQFLNNCSYDSGPYDIVTSPFKTLPELSNDNTLAKNFIKKQLDELMIEVSRKAKEGKKDKEPDRPVATPTVKPIPLDVPKVAKDTAPDDAKITLPGEEAEAPKSDTLGKDSQKEVKPVRVSEAEGAIRDGNNADQYIRLGKGVNIDQENPELLRNFKGMVQEFGETTGESVTVTSGKRSREQQEALFKKDPTKAAKPGRSLHEFGLALDADSAALNKMEEMGLMRKYGFTRPVGGEPWHTEPAGIQVNLANAKQDSNFASNAIAASLFKGGGGAGITPEVPKGKRDSKLAMATMDLDATRKPSAANEEMLASVTPKAETSVKPSSFRMGTQAVSAKEPTESTKVASNTSAKSSKYKQADTTGTEEGTPFETNPVATANSKPMPATKEEVKTTIADAAKKANGDPEVLQTFAAIESGLNPRAKAKGTSAEGPYQFLNATWNEQVSKNGNKYGVDQGTPKTDVTASTYMASELIKQNEKGLKGVVNDPGVSDLYLAHLLGLGGARKLLSARPDARAADILPDAAKTNPSIFYKDGYALTCKELYASITSKVTTKAQQFNIPLAPDEVAGATKIYSDTTGTTTVKDTTGATKPVTKTASQAPVDRAASSYNAPPVPEKQFSVPTPVAQSTVSSGAAKPVDTAIVDTISKIGSKTNDLLSSQVDLLGNIFNVLKVDILNSLNKTPGDTSIKSAVTPSNRKAESMPSFGLDLNRRLPA